MDEGIVHEYTIENYSFITKFALNNFLGTKFLSCFVNKNKQGFTVDYNKNTAEKKGFSIIPI
ncbi:MAG TPA: hypothetical protein VIO64_20365 [Pseudobacteroides sp.]|uniref:hypothetical protein n=1 Tax=Pseudobacteroides sp. TaxID=1968840 RepID=UPI002F92843A